MVLRQVTVASGSALSPGGDTLKRNRIRLEAAPRPSTISILAVGGESVKPAPRSGKTEVGF